MGLGPIGSDGLPQFVNNSSDPRVDAVLRQIYDQVKVNILGGHVDASALKKALDDARPQVQRLFSLSDRLENATTPGAQEAVLGEFINFIEGNGGNKMALYPYLAQKGFDPSVLEAVGINPRDIETVANNIKAKTPVTQADMEKLGEANAEQVQNLESLIAELRERIRALVEEQQRMNDQLATQQDAMVAGPSTRPTEGLAPTEGAVAPQGTMTATELANLANVPRRV